MGSGRQPWCWTWLWGVGKYAWGRASKKWGSKLLWFVKLLLVSKTLFLTLFNVDYFIIFVDNEIDGDMVVQDVDLQSFGRRTRMGGGGEDIMDEDDDSDYWHRVFLIFYFAIYRLVFCGIMLKC